MVPQSSQVLLKMPKQDPPEYLYLIFSILFLGLLIQLLLFHQSLTRLPLIIQHLKDFTFLHSPCLFILYKQKEDKLISCFNFSNCHYHCQSVPHLTSRMDTQLPFPLTHLRETFPLMVHNGNSFTPVSSTSTSQHGLNGI